MIVKVDASTIEKLNKAPGSDIKGIDNIVSTVVLVKKSIDK